MFLAAMLAFGLNLRPLADVSIGVNGELQIGSQVKMSIMSLSLESSSALTARLVKTMVCEMTQCVYVPDRRCTGPTFCSLLLLDCWGL